MPPTPDTGAAVEWLKAWSPDGPWIVVEIAPETPNPQPVAHEFASTDALSKYLSENNGKVNLYFVPNRVDFSKCERYKDGRVKPPKKEAITHVVALSADLDLPKNGDNCEPNERNFNLLLMRIHELIPSSSIIVNSGGGLQSFWLFDELYPATEYLDRTESVGQAISRNLGSDHIQNINRLMRLPGTINIPSEDKRKRGRVPALAHIIEADWSRRWSFGTDPVPHIDPTIVREYEFDPENDVSSVQAKLDLLPNKWINIIKTGKSDKYDDDQSRMVMALIFYLLPRGWTDDEIITILSDRKYGISLHCWKSGNGPREAARQVARVRGKASSDWDRNHFGNINVRSPRNIRRAFDELGVKVSYDAFSLRTWVNGVETPALLDDTVDSKIMVRIHDTFGFWPNREVIDATLRVLADEGRVHPVQEYLDSLSWDGVSRLDTWLIDIAGATDDEAGYARTIGRLTLLAAVRRIRQPGCKFDEMLVLITPNQGTSKSSALAALAVKDEWFTDSFTLRLRDREAIEQLAGRWIVECPELSGMNQADVEAVKALLSRGTDRARLVWHHHPTDARRQCVFIGTTNSTAFLRDRNNRRFWPIRIQRIDVQQLIDIRDQLWAEAAHREAEGESIGLPEELWSEAAKYQENARAGEAWVDILFEHLGEQTGRIAILDVWQIVGKPGHQRGAADNSRLTEAMLELGWERTVQRINNVATRCFMRGETEGERQRVLTVFVDISTGFPKPSVIQVEGSNAQVKKSLEDYQYDPECPF